MPMVVRQEITADIPSIHHLHRSAFGSAKEADLVDGLRAGGYVVVSLVADLDGSIVGHILFSRMLIQTSHATVEALSLAPMAVRPKLQRQGIGSLLVRAGLEACRAAQHEVVIVLGHPHFYKRFGFSAKLAGQLANPFNAGDAWMALELRPGALTDIEGVVCYAPPFGIETTPSNHHSEQ